MSKHTEYEDQKMNDLSDEMLKDWEENQTFKKSGEPRPIDKPFVFYKGTSSAVFDQVNICFACLKIGIAKVKNHWLVFQIK